MPLPPAFDLDRALADVHWMVDELGPRAHGSPGEAAAADGVKARLERAGWAVQTIGPAGNHVACRGRGGRLLLAHIDSVPGSPGAIDNAAGVATLLELARTTAAPDLCLGFPVGEEVGLRGSVALAGAPSRWHPGGGAPALVVALDLTGHGTLSMMGLGPAWGPDRLAWLVDHADPLPDTTFPYTIYSRDLPQAERSDHAPFGLQGIPSLLLLGRGETGIYPHYHQATDTRVDPEALAATAAVLESLARAPLPPPRRAPGVGDATFLAGGVRVPGWLVWATLAAGLLAALRGLRQWREIPDFLGRAAAATAATGMLTAPIVGAGLFPLHAAEATAEAVMGIGASGWWWGAWPALLLGAGAFLGVRHLLGPRGSAPLAAGALAVPLALLDPVLAFPWAVGALLGLLHPLLTVLPALVLLRPDTLRELAFHGLLPPVAWGLLWALATPAIGRYVGRRPAAAPPEEPSP